MTTQEIGHALNRLRDTGHVTGGQMGQRAYWSMTPKGKKLLKQFPVRKVWPLSPDGRSRHD